LGQKLPLFISDLLQFSAIIFRVSIKVMILLVCTGESGMRFLTRPFKRYVHVQSDLPCLQIMWTGYIFNPLIIYNPNTCRLLLLPVLFLVPWCFEPLAILYT
jgi:hypothetical protein